MNSCKVEVRKMIRKMAFKAGSRWGSSPTNLLPRMSRLWECFITKSPIHRKAWKWSLYKIRRQKQKRNKENEKSIKKNADKAKALTVNWFYTPKNVRYAEPQL